MCVKNTDSETNLLESRLGCCFYKVYDINEMFQIINLVNFTPTLILIDLDQIDEVNLQNFINTIKTLLSYNTKINNYTPVIAGIFSKTTEITLIKTAIAANMSGFVPQGQGFTIEEQEHSLRELITSNYHIPGDILEKIYQYDVNNTAKIITYYSTDNSVVVNLQRIFAEKLQVTLNAVDNLQNLFEMLSDSKFHTDYICLDVNEIYKQDITNVFEIISTINTILACSKIKNSRVSVAGPAEIIAAISEDLDPKKIREILSIPSISGVVLKPSIKVNGDMMIDTWKNILDHKREVPSLIKDWIKPKKTRVLKDIDGITLTDRQSQVLTLIQTRGSSNKVIAKTLNLSESTVKLHIGAILKKYGLRNRTQLALFTSQKS